MPSQAKLALVVFLYSVKNSSHLVDQMAAMVGAVEM
jgi:hypothetical protein